MKLFIRNMACESCKAYVNDALLKLKLHPIRVELGEADIKEELKDDQKQKLNALIQKVGLEIAENKDTVLIEQIKKSALEYATSIDPPTANFSDYLSHKLKYDYNYLSTLFTDIEACTITHYMNLVKMERAKEMIIFEDLTLSEIAHKLHYSHLSHFSAQFKKVTGFSPSHYKTLKNKRRKTIQKLNDNRRR